MNTSEHWSRIRILFEESSEDLVPVVVVVVVLLTVQTDLVLGGGRDQAPAGLLLAGRHLELLLRVGVVSLHTVGEDVVDPVGWTEGPGTAVGVGHAQISLEVAALSSRGRSTTESEM